MSNNKTKWHTISKALLLTNGSPEALEILNALYEGDLLKVNNKNYFTELVYAVLEYEKAPTRFHREREEENMVRLAKNLRAKTYE